MECLAQAQLFPEVIELTPCALQVAAHAARLPGDALLIHPLDDALLWASPHSLPFQFGLFDSTQARADTALSDLIRSQYRAGALCATGKRTAAKISSGMNAGRAQRDKSVIRPLYLPTPATLLPLLGWR